MTDNTRRDALARCLCARICRDDRTVEQLERLDYFLTHIEKTSSDPIEWASRYLADYLSPVRDSVEHRRDGVVLVATTSTPHEPELSPIAIALRELRETIPLDFEQRPPAFATLKNEAALRDIDAAFDQEPWCVDNEIETVIDDSFEVITGKVPR